MSYSLMDLRHAFELMLPEFYPHMQRFQWGYYTQDDLLDQLVFEIIKEENKKYGQKNTITYYLIDDEHLYDEKANPAQYSKDIKRVQKIRDFNNDRLEEVFGIRLEDLDAQDMSAPRRFEGRMLRRDEFLQYWIDYRTGLLGKLHGHQISDSHKVSNEQFTALFSAFYYNIDKMMPPVNEPDLILPHTLAYFGIETYFLVNFLYNVVLAAEKHSFPRLIPVDRILHICSLTPVYPANEWCPKVCAAVFQMLMKWHDLTDYVFSADENKWTEIELLTEDCKRIKSLLLQRSMEKTIDLIHQCSLQEKNEFILEHYWCWDSRPVDGYEWTPQRISYFRRLYEAVAAGPK